MTKTATIILQELMLDLTYAKLKHHAPIECYYQELERNMIIMLKNKLPYMVIENSLSEYGYEIPDIRKVFYKLTQVDPQKMLYAKFEDLKNTPDFIPTYNYGWGQGKDKCYYYIIKDDFGGFVLYKISVEESDGVLKYKINEPEKIKHDLSLSVVRKELAKRVKHPKFYDIPAWEDALNYKGELKFNSKDYEAIEELISTSPIKQIKSKLEKFVKNGNLYYDEALYLLKKYAAEEEEQEEKKTDLEDEKEDEEDKKEMKEKQNEDVNLSIKKMSPTDYFKSNIPNRMDHTIPEHIKTVLTYINNKASDMLKFSVKLYKLNYEIHTIPASVVSQHEDTNIENYKAVVNTILEFNEKGTDKPSKFGLMLFFVAPNGYVTTSDSFKGEDDIIYGFTEEGISQYLQKNT